MDFEKFDEEHRKLWDSNKQAAEQMALAYCLQNNKSEIYTKYFVKLIYELYGLEDSIRMAEIYETSYLEQIAAGKSEIYSVNYAELCSEEKWTKNYIAANSRFYEKAILEGKTVGFALNYADGAGELACGYKEGVDYENDPYFNFKLKEVIEEIEKNGFYRG